MPKRPHRPRLDEALAIASDWSVEDCRELLESENDAERLLVHELGIERAQPNRIERATVLHWPSTDPVKVWSRFREAGLVEENGWRSFACPPCNGTARVGVADEQRICDHCEGFGPYRTPMRMTWAIAFASDWTRVRAFEDRVRMEHDAVLWRLRYGADAEAKPRYIEESSGQIVLAASDADRRLPEIQNTIGPGPKPVLAHLAILSFPEL